MEGFEISKHFPNFASIKDMDTKPLIERLAALIHTLRERGGPTQADIATRLSISDGQLSNQLSGRNRPSVDRVEAIAGAAGHYLELLAVTSAARIATLQTGVYADEEYTAAQVVELALYALQRETNGFAPADRERYFQAREKQFRLTVAQETARAIEIQMADRSLFPPKQLAKYDRQLARLGKEAETLTAEIAALLAGLAPG